jgi:hypothetical protein
VETSQCRFASKQHNRVGWQRACRLNGGGLGSKPTHQYRSPRGNHRARMVKKTEAGRELGSANPHSVGVPEAGPAYLAAIVAVVDAREAVMNWARIPTYIRGVGGEQEPLARNEYFTDETRITKAKLKGGLNSRTASEPRDEAHDFCRPLLDRCEGRNEKMWPEKQCDGMPNRHLACKRSRSAESSQANTANWLASLRLWSRSTQRA